MPASTKRPTMACVIVLTCCVVAALGAPLWALSPRVAVCTPAAAAPALDGKLDDACWKTAGVATDFLLDSGQGLPADATVVRLCFDKDFLYLGIECMESDWTTVKADVRQHDANVDSDDDVEVFFDTSRERKGFHQFLFNTLGTKVEQLNGSAAWDVDWTVSVARAADRWTAEVAIPLAALGGAKVGDAWGFNIGRGQPVKKAAASFAGITGRWTNPGGFATLRFAAEAGGEGRLFAGEGGVRVWALHPEQRLDLLALPAPADERLAAFGTPGETVPYAFHVLNLGPKAPASVGITAEPFTGPAGKLDVPASSLLSLSQKMAGDYMWEFLGPGRQIQVKPGQRGGFWLDYTVPAGAKPGVYTSTVTLTIDADGKPSTQTRTVKLLVLPFALDANPTSCGFHYPKEKDPAEVRESLGLMRDHGMTTFAPYGNWGAARGVGDYVRLHKEFGFTGKLIYADTVMGIGDRLAYEMKLPTRGPKLRDSHRTWEINDEYRRRFVAEMKTYLDEAKAAGHPEISFSIGDELTSDGFWGATHLADRAKALREGLPDINITTDANGYKEVIGASKWLTCVGINDGWPGPDSHNSPSGLITEPVLNEIKANGCTPEFVNAGMGRYMFGYYFWRMTRWGIASKIEWIWHSDRMEPSWLNVHREDGKTFVTVALKQSRAGTYDTRYAATLENLAKKTGDSKAGQVLAAVTSRIPIAHAEARGNDWGPARCDAVRWMLAKEIMRLKGASVGVAPEAGDGSGEMKLEPESAWQAAPPEKTFVRHVSRTFAAAPVAAAPALDGKLDDPAWGQAEVVRSAYRDTDLSLVEGMMDVRMVHTDKGLFLGIASREPAPEKIATGTRGNDDPDLWQVDAVEVFVDPTKAGDYYHLIFDAKGTKSDYRKQDLAWNGDWRVASRLEGNTWTAEVFLPFDTFGGKDKPWGIMVGRGSPTRNESFGIMPIKGSWHDFKQFGTVEFAAPKPYIDSVGFPRLGVGQNTLAVTVANPTDRPVDATVRLDPAGVATAPVKALAPGAAVRVPLTIDLKTSGGHELLARLLGPNDQELDREAFAARVDELLSLTPAQDAIFSGSARRAFSVAINLPPEQLAGGTLDLELNGAGVKKSLSVTKLDGNRGTLALTLPKLKEGAYRLTATLRLGGRPAAETSVELFVTNGPAF